MKQTKYLYLIVHISLVLLIVTSCANIVAPSGGLGDRTAPKIHKTSIANATTNFSNNTISLEFNKYMDRGSVIEALNISPTIKYTAKWNAKELRVKFMEPFENNTTYTLQLSGSYKDYYGNTAAEAFYITFATGAIIDTGYISGRIIGKKTEGISIFTYKLRDSIDYYNTTPDYKIIIGSNGKFTVPALKDGKYRIIAVLDKDKNSLISPQQDSIGIPCFDATVFNGKSDSIKILLSLVPQKADASIDITTNNISKLDSTSVAELDSSKIAIDTSVAELDSSKIAIDSTVAASKPKMKVSGSVKFDNIFNNIKISDTTTTNNFKYYILLVSTRNEYVAPIKENNEYEFAAVESGTYTIFVFLDKNDNQKFDRGNLTPWEFCEPFDYVEQELVVKDNWDVSNFLINSKFLFLE